MFVSIGELSLMLGVSIVTLRRWNKSGELMPCFVTFGGHRRYSVDKIKTLFGFEEKKERLTVAYARVSSHDQKEDLKRQEERLNEVIRDIPRSILISDLGSGINFKKKGLKKLIYLIITGQVEKIIITHKDRLIRFGFEMIEKIASHFGTKIEILNGKEEVSFEEELSKDVLTIITVFSAKLYGKRSHKNKSAKT